MSTASESGGFQPSSKAGGSLTRVSLSVAAAPTCCLADTSSGFLMLKCAWCSAWPLRTSCGVKKVTGRLPTWLRFGTVSLAHFGGKHVEPRQCSARETSPPMLMLRRSSGDVVPCDVFFGTADSLKQLKNSRRIVQGLTLSFDDRRRVVCRVSADHHFCDRSVRLVTR
jgi:hypothetical protein